MIKSKVTQTFTFSDQELDAAIAMYLEKHHGITGDVAVNIKKYTTCTGFGLMESYEESYKVVATVEG